MEILKGMVFDIQRYSIHDGPGIRTIIFFKGCPLRCRWCSNPESFNQQKEIIWHSKKCIGCFECISVCREQAVHISNSKEIIIDRARCTNCGKCVTHCYANALDFYGKEMSVEDVMQEVRKDLGFYKNSGGGITLSGGEFTSQYDFALELLKQCKMEGIHTAVETTGHCQWSKLKSLLEYIDLILYDLKIMDDDKHKKYTGVSNEIILDNLKKVDDTRISYIIRMPLIPTVNDDQKNAEQMVTFLSNLKSSITIQILPYHNYGLNKYNLLDIQYPLGGINPPSREEIAQFIDCFNNTEFKLEYMV